MQSKASPHNLASEEEVCKRFVYLAGPEAPNLDAVLKPEFWSVVSYDLRKRYSIIQVIADTFEATLRILDAKELPNGGSQPAHKLTLRLVSSWQADELQLLAPLPENYEVFYVPQQGWTAMWHHPLANGPIATGLSSEAEATNLLLAHARKRTKAEAEYQASAARLHRA